MTLLDDLGIETCQVSFGKEATFAGQPVEVSLQIEAGALGVSGPLNLRWIASGDMLSSFIDEAVAQSGEQGFISLPTTSQDGFARGTQLFSGWFYRATVMRKRNGKSLNPRVYRFQIPAGTTSMDLDALDENGQVTALPATAPMPTVSSFLGLTGAITQDDLPGLPPSGGAGGALSGNYPSPGLNASSVDSVVGDRIGTIGTATRQAVDARVTAGTSTVGRTGAYADLAGKPTIPSTPDAVGAEPAGLSSATAASLAATYSPLDRGTAAQLASWKSKQTAGTEYVWNLTDGAGTLLDIVSGVV